MDGLFLEILNLSLYGSFAIVAVLILRFLLKKSPKSISYGLWLVVFLALILPVRIKTSYSPMPVGVESFRQEKLYQAVPQAESGISVVDAETGRRSFSHGTDCGRGFCGMVCWDCDFAGIRHDFFLETAEEAEKRGKAGIECISGGRIAHSVCDGDAALHLYSGRFDSGRTGICALS